MTKKQTSDVIKIWSRMGDRNVGSWSDLCVETVEEYTKPHNALAAAVLRALPLLKHFENQLAGSLSCDSRSHDDDRKYRIQINAILKAAEKYRAARRGR